MCGLLTMTQRDRTSRHLDCRPASTECADDRGVVGHRRTTLSRTWGTESSNRPSRTSESYGQHLHHWTDTNRPCLALVGRSPNQRIQSPSRHPSQFLLIVSPTVCPCSDTSISQPSPLDTIALVGSPALRLSGCLERRSSPNVSDPAPRLRPSRIHHYMRRRKEQEHDSTNHSGRPAG